MADRYVDSSVGASGTGLSWAQALKTLKEGTDAAAAGETVYVASGHSETITAADTTLTLAAGVRVISANKTSGDPPTTYTRGAFYATTGAGIDINLTGEGSFIGLDFSVGTSTQAAIIALGSGAGKVEFQDCTFTHLGTSATGAIRIGGAGAAQATKVITRGCSFIWTSTGQGFILHADYESYDDDFSAGSTHPTVLFEVIHYSGRAQIFGGDLTDIDTVFETTPAAAFDAVLSGCSMKSGFAVFAPTAGGVGDAIMYDCAVGDQHYQFAHFNYYGTTTISTSVYCSNAGASYDGTNYHSWVVSSTANATRANPYVSPWIPAYFAPAGTPAAITPYLESLRSGSTTKYKETEVYTEWMYKDTASSARMALVSSADGPLVAVASGTDNTASSFTASDWVGEDGTNNAFMKLQPNATITPQEIGHVMGRIVVAKASVTDLYVDPKIRGLS